MSQKLWNRKHGYSGDGLRNNPPRGLIRFPICTINDHDYLCRGIDVPEIQNRFNQVHFFPCGNDNGAVKNSPANPIDCPIAIADFGDIATGVGETRLQTLTVLRTNQQDSIRSTQHLTTEPKHACRLVSRFFRLRRRLMESQCNFSHSATQFSPQFVSRDCGASSEAKSNRNASHQNALTARGKFGVYKGNTCGSQTKRKSLTVCAD